MTTFNRAKFQIEMTAPGAQMPTMQAALDDIGTLPSTPDGYHHYLTRWNDTCTISIDADDTVVSYEEMTFWQDNLELSAATPIGVETGFEHATPE